MLLDLRGILPTEITHLPEVLPLLWMRPPQVVTGGAQWSGVFDVARAAFGFRLDVIQFEKDGLATEHTLVVSPTLRLPLHWFREWHFSKSPAPGLSGSSQFKDDVGHKVLNRVLGLGLQHCDFRGMSSGVPAVELLFQDPEHRVRDQPCRAAHLDDLPFRQLLEVFELGDQRHRFLVGVPHRNPIIERLESRWVLEEPVEEVVESQVPSHHHRRAEGLCAETADDLLQEGPFLDAWDLCWEFGEQLFYHDGRLRLTVLFIKSLLDCSMQPKSPAILEKFTRSSVKETLQITVQPGGSVA